MKVVGTRSASAFTLVEIVIGLTILGILAGVTIPTLRTIEKEREARAPVTELARMARTVSAVPRGCTRPDVSSMFGCGVNSETAPGKAQR